jgi:hypothetical protein
MNAFMTKDKGKKKKKKLLVSWGMAETMSWAKRKRICLWNHHLRTNIFQVTLNPCWEVDEKHVRHTGCQ